VRRGIGITSTKYKDIWDRIWPRTSEVGKMKGVGGLGLGCLIQKAVVWSLHGHGLSYLDHGLENSNCVHHESDKLYKIMKIFRHMHKLKD
jgi:signal transduction histidine kinase